MELNGSDYQHRQRTRIFIDDQHAEQEIGGELLLENWVMIDLVDSPLDSGIDLLGKLH